MEKRKGFTLIELLVVIAIIALLLAIIMPSLQRARNSARAVVCQSNLKQFGIIFHILEEDYPGFLFSPDNQYFPLLLSNTSQNKVDKGLRKEKIYLCPMALTRSKRLLQGSLIRGYENSEIVIPTGETLDHLENCYLGSAFKAWECMDLKLFLADPNMSIGSYGMNVNLGSTTLLFKKSTRGGIPSIMIKPWKLGTTNSYSLKNPSKIPVLLDSASPWSIFFWPDQSPPLIEEEETSCCINRHNGGVNSLFMDWSVRKVGLKELWKLKWHEEYNTNGPYTLAGGVTLEKWPLWMRGFKDY